jgi:hypothetical protein
MSGCYTGGVNSLLGPLPTDEKNDERWVVMMAKQDIKIELEKERVTVKKWKDFFLLTADTSMDVDTKEWYVGEPEAILQWRRPRAPPTLEAAPTPTPTPTTAAMTTVAPTLSMPEKSPLFLFDFRSTPVL